MKLDRGLLYQSLLQQVRKCAIIFLHVIIVTLVKEKLCHKNNYNDRKLKYRKNANKLHGEHQKFVLS